jgi:Fe-S-cluster containining protein
MNQDLASFLPSIYRNFLPSLMGGTIADEPQATCDNCAMCGEKAAALLDRKAAFNPNTKCCTYHPRLPNYLVGAVLADSQMKDAHAIFRRLINQHQGVYPWGIIPDKKYDVLFTLSKGSFGKSEELLCPYFQRESGFCAIWKHREAICSTFFCKHSEGKKGHDFWMAFKKYLILVEQRLSDYVLYQLFPNALGQGIGKIKKDVDSLTFEELEGKPPLPDRVKNHWKNWLGKEEVFFRKAFELIQKLDQARFSEVMGIEGKIKLRSLAIAREAMQSQMIPSRLAFNRSSKIRSLNEEEISITTYAKTNPLRIKRKVLKALRVFDGSKSTEDMKEAIARNGKVKLDDQLILKLYHFDVLQESNWPISSN